MTEPFLEQSLPFRKPGIDPTWFPKHGLSPDEYQRILNEVEKAWKLDGFSLITVYKSSPDLCYVRSLRVHLDNLLPREDAFHRYRQFYNAISIDDWQDQSSALQFIYRLCWQSYQKPTQPISLSDIVKVIKLTQTYLNTDHRVFLYFLEDNWLFLSDTYYVNPGCDHVAETAVSQFTTLVKSPKSH